MRSYTVARQKACWFFYALESIYDTRLIRSTIVEVHRDRFTRLQHSVNSSRIIFPFSLEERNVEIFNSETDYDTDERET